MAVFFYARNNGVVAMIRSDDAALFGTVTKAEGNPFKVGIRVFTFCDSERLEESPRERRFFTGSMDLMRKLEKKGHTFEANISGSGWNGFVPLSNQEHNTNPDGEWQNCLTTAQDVVDKFELLN